MAVTVYQPRERYVDARELAEALHVSESTVRRWVLAGMPSRTWGLRVRRFLLSECEAWLQQHAEAGGDTLQEHRAP